VAVDVGEAHVSRRKAKGAFGVVDAEEVEHGGVEVVDLHFVFDGLVAPVVGRSVATSPGLTPPPASQVVKPKGLWSRPFPPWAKGVRPNSPVQTTSVSSRRPSFFRSVMRAAIGWSTVLQFLP